MGKKTYRFCNLRKWKDFNKKNSLPYLKCVLRLSWVVHGPIKVEDPSEAVRRIHRRRTAVNSLYGCSRLQIPTR